MYNMLPPQDLPYMTCQWDTAELLGHGDRARKMEVVDKFLEMEALDDNYREIYKVLKQNLLIEEALDNDEDQEPPPKKRAPAKAPAKKAAAKKK